MLDELTQNYLLSDVLFKDKILFSGYLHECQTFLKENQFKYNFELTIQTY